MKSKKVLKLEYDNLQSQTVLCTWQGLNKYLFLKTIWPSCLLPITKCNCTGEAAVLSKVLHVSPLPLTTPCSGGCRDGDTDGPAGIFSRTKNM